MRFLFVCFLTNNQMYSFRNQLLQLYDGAFSIIIHCHSQHYLWENPTSSILSWIVINWISFLFAVVVYGMLLLLLWWWWNPSSYFHCIITPNITHVLIHRRTGAQVPGPGYIKGPTRLMGTKNKCEIHREKNEMLRREFYSDTQPARRE